MAAATCERAHDGSHSATGTDVGDRHTYNDFMPPNFAGISSVSEWNQSLRAATADGRTVVVDFWATWCAPCKVSGLFPTIRFVQQFSPGSRRRSLLSLIDSRTNFLMSLSCALMWMRRSPLLQNSKYFVLCICFLPHDSYFRTAKLALCQLLLPSSPVNPLTPYAEFRLHLDPYIFIILIQA